MGKEFQGARTASAKALGSLQILRNQRYSSVAGVEGQEGKRNGTGMGQQPQADGVGLLVLLRICLLF